MLSFKDWTQIRTSTGGAVNSATAQGPPRRRLAQRRQTLRNAKRNSGLEIGSDMATTLNTVIRMWRARCAPFSDISTPSFSRRHDRDRFEKRTDRQGNVLAGEWGKRRSLCFIPLPNIPLPIFFPKRNFVPHSKTLRAQGTPPKIRQVLECERGSAAFAPAPAWKQI